MRKKVFLNDFVSLCLILLTVLFSSCTGGDTGNGEIPAEPASPDTVFAEEEISDTVSDMENAGNSAETEITEISAETSETEAGNDGDDPDSQIEENKEEDQENSGNPTETPAKKPETETKISDTQTSKQTESVSQTTTVTTTAAVTTTATAAPKPAAEVVIPKINMPQSPGTNVISGGDAEVDYSNASEGYISAVYKGSKKAKIRIKCGSTQYDHDLSAGGKREYFPLMGNGSYSVSVYEQASGSKYALLADGDFDVNIKNSTGMYLYPNKYIDFDSKSNCVRKAAELCAGITDDLDKVAAIFTYTAENITYDKQLAATVQSGYVPNPDSTLSAKKGICFDYASLFAAMCRSQGIPTRLVIGYADPNIYHAWNEVYTPETGWITPELFFKNKGYNIADATFYASNSDKDKIAKYISDDGNYSAIYRY